MRPGEPLSLTVTLPNMQRIEIPEAVVRWSRGQQFAVENVAIEPHTQARLAHYWCSNHWRHHHERTTPQTRQHVHRRNHHLLLYPRLNCGQVT